MLKKSATIYRESNFSVSLPSRLLIFSLVLGALGFTVYGNILFDLFIKVASREGSSHGIFVPFISLYIIWLRSDEIRRLNPQERILPGSMTAVVGLLLLYPDYASTGLFFPVLSFLVVAGGLILMLFGTELFKKVAFPLFFLAAMIPLPETLYGQIADLMRTATTWGSVIISKILGVPLHREGFDIFLPDLHLYVAHSCSGIRYLLSYPVFGIAYGFRFKQTNQARLLIVLGAIPLAIFGGIIRLSVIFVTAHYIGPIMIEHRPHVLLSWSVFTMLLAGIITLDRYFAINTGTREKVHV